MNYKNRTADIVYGRMLETTPEQIAHSSIAAMDAIQSDKVGCQMLGLAAALICMLHQYGLTHTDVLGIADNMVYSGENNNMRREFKCLQNFMKNEWEI